MGISSTMYVEEQEEEQRESLIDEMAQDAAVEIIGGIDRASAIESAKVRIAAQQDAISSGEISEDQNGIIYFDDPSIESPQIPEGKKAQVLAIAGEIRMFFE